jgi:UPF0271 protein
MITTIDLSTEVGEGFALPPFGLPTDTWRRLEIDGRRMHERQFMRRFDDELLPYVTSASVACGLHSGDPVVIADTVKRLAARGIAIGAHPSYPDVFGFGQQRVDVDREGLKAVLLYQLGSLRAIVESAGAKLQHVWFHGALAFDVNYDAGTCEAVVELLLEYDPSLTLVLMMGAPCIATARRLGARMATLAFLDRGYGADGRIVPRHHPQALLRNADEVAARAVSIVRNGTLQAVDGSAIPASADMLLVHCDTPGAGDMARAAFQALEDAGVRVRPAPARG